MRPRFKTAVQSALHRRGWEIRRIRSQSPSRAPLETAMSALLACQGRVRVVQVGANDGVVNDPLHAFMMAHCESTAILLVEPLPQLIPHLSANYRNHPAHTIANLAVGRPGTLILHAVDEQCWPDCQPPYAQDWPSYRAPTGVTSGDREHVVRWLREHYKGPLNPDQAIATFRTECLPLVELAERVRFGVAVDVLQVDVEGFDDEVIYQSSISVLQPKLINFENAHLPEDRLRRLESMLIDNGYELQVEGVDTLAIRTRA